MYNVEVIEIFKPEEKIMLRKTLISVGIGILIGISPLRNSALANILIMITGG